MKDSTVKTITINGDEFDCPFCDLLPPLADEERAGLEADIQVHGILQPVIYTRHAGRFILIDGHNRAEIAAELGKPVPVREKEYPDFDAMKAHALELNLLRRHLSREDKQRLIADTLKANPEWSDRRIAELLAVDHKTVGAVRKELESGGEIPHPKKRKDKNGNQQSANKANTTKPTVAMPAADNLPKDVTPQKPNPSPAPEPPDTPDEQDTAEPIRKAEPPKSVAPPIPEPAEEQDADERVTHTPTAPPAATTTDKEKWEWDNDWSLDWGEQDLQDLSRDFINATDEAEALSAVDKIEKWIAVVRQEIPVFFPKWRAFLNSLLGKLKAAEASGDRATAKRLRRAMKEYGFVVPKP